MITTLIASTLLSGGSFDYKIGTQVFEGYRSIVQKSKLTVVVVQDWNGVGDHEKEVVDKLAKLGYSAVAIDIYGKGVRPSSVESCQAESGKFYASPAMYHERMQGGIKAAGITGKYAAIGYCFGGTGVLELARINMKGMVGAVSFHGGLKPLTPAPKKMNANVIVMHGLDDPFIPEADFNAISGEMNKAKSFKLFAFPGAVHAFTVKSMGFKVDGAKYDAEADKLSWKELAKALKSWSK